MALGILCEPCQPGQCGQGKRWWVRLHEKGGKLHNVPAHHKLEVFLNAYMDAVGVLEDNRGLLFRTGGGTTKRLTANLLTRRDV